MARPPHPIGTAGKVRTYRTASGWRARTTVRDYDGKTREVQRHGQTEASAKRYLAEALRDRTFAGGGTDMNRDARVAVLAERWFSDLTGKAPRTVEQYRYALDRSIIPGLGSLRIRELTVATSDRFLRAVQSAHGAPVARTTKAVLSSICSYGARLDLLDRNPVRDTSPISGKPKNVPEALTIEQVRDLRAALTYDDLAKKRDIPDLIDFLLATGLRISEASAVRWCDLDLKARTVRAGRNVVRIKGVGMVVQEGDSSKLTARTLDLPTWVVEMLKRRRLPGQRPADPVFPAPSGTGWRDPSNTQADLKAALRPIGYGWVKTHTFRKTVASLMDDAGQTPRNIADQLGHSRPSMSQDIYMARRTQTGAAVILEALG